MKQASRFSPWWVAAICIALAGVTWTVFGQTLQHDFINYDDNLYIYENPDIVSGLTRPAILWAFTHAHAGNWHPLTSLSHMLDCQVFGLNAGGHHFTNVLLHTLAVVLLFLFLQQVTGAPWRSAFVAAVFAVHPLRVESVAWIAERKDVLSGVFFMLTLLAYARYVSGERSLLRYLLVAFFFALGLMAKPMLVTLPLVLLLLDYWPLCRFGSRSSGKDANFARRSTFFGLVAEKIPLCLLSLLSSLVTWRVQQAFVRSTSEIPLLLRIENAIVSYVRYLWQLLWPADLAPFYPHPPAMPLLVVIAAAVLLGAISAVVLCYGRKRPYLTTGWGWYLIMLLPVIGLVQVGEQALADRYTYLPQIGIALAITWTVADATAGIRQLQRFVAFTAVAVTVTLAWCACHQTRYWRNSESLWLQTLAVTENNDLAHNNLGDVWSKSGRVDDAIQEFQAALKVTPESPVARNNLGSAFLKQGKVAEAIQEFRRVLSRDPQSITGRFNLAGALLRSGRATEAVAEYEKVLAIKPDFAQGHLALGHALMRAWRLADAIAQFKIAVQLQPGHAHARNSLATAFAAKQQWGEAIRCWRETLKINPNDVAAQSGLAWTLATAPDPVLRNGAEALAISQHLSKTTDASNPMLLRVLAAAYAEAGRFPEAIETTERGIALATSQHRADLAALLQGDLKLLQSAQPLRDAGKSPITR
ncbi:MAG TPA: tetratricopeptide repeat protein [Candidatus Baltobacteraceae bacterium]|jgi:tetratricopeptide (TPR) repeat protein|nr:tetratricopeptide repeat protein [Candidatus Baltobacteraceae bacterium]